MDGSWWMIKVLNIVRLIIPSCIRVNYDYLRPPCGITDQVARSLNCDPEDSRPDPISPPGDRSWTKLED